MPFYKTKPFVVEAIQWDGTDEMFSKFIQRLSTYEAGINYEPSLTIEKDIFMKPLRKDDSIYYISKGSFIIFKNKNIIIADENEFLEVFEIVA